MAYTEEFTRDHIGHQSVIEQYDAGGIYAHCDHRFIACVLVFVVNVVSVLLLVLMV